MLMNPGPARTLAEMTVLIPTLGRPMLLDCLRSIRSGTSLPAEILIVDQGWNEANAAAVQALASPDFPIRHVRSAGRGRAAGVNEGLRLVRTRCVAITDDDCLVDEDWLATALSVLEEYGEAVVTGLVVTGTDTQTAGTALRKVWRRRSLKLDPLAGGNMAMPLSVPQRAGYFDEDPRVRVAEDCEWSYRVLRARIPVVFAGDMKVLHRDWRSGEERRAQFAAYARSHGAWYGKHLGGGDLFILLRLATHHARALKRWALGALRGDRAMAENGRAYLLGLIPGLRTTLWNRRPD